MGDRKRKYGSVYDEFYSRIGNKWTCRNCKNFAKEIDVVENGTRSLSNHLEKNHPHLYKELQKKSQEKTNQQPPIKSAKTETPKTEGMRQMKIGEAPLRATDDAKSVKIDKAIMKFLAAAALPLSLVDHPAFRDLIRLLDSRYHLRTRKYFGSTLLNNCYDDAKEKIKRELKKQPWITLVLDEWSDEAQTHALIGVSAHFLDSDYKNKHYVLGAKTLKKMQDNEEELTTKKKKKLHGAENMARIVKEIIDEFELDESKIFIILRDGASTVVKLCKILGKKSSHCFAHLLQLVIKDALKKVRSFDQLLLRIKKFIKKLRKSYKLNDAFKEAQFLENLPELVLQRGIEVRWSSLYLMLDSFLNNKEAIKRVIEENDLDEFSKKDWEISMARDHVFKSRSRPVPVPSI